MRCRRTRARQRSAGRSTAGDRLAGTGRRDPSVRQIVEQAAGFLALRGVALLQHLIQDAARAIRDRPCPRRPAPGRAWCPPRSSSAPPDPGAGRSSPTSAPDPRPWLVTDVEIHLAEFGRGFAQTGRRRPAAAPPCPRQPGARPCSAVSWSCHGALLATGSTLFHGIAEGRQVQRAFVEEPCRASPQSNRPPAPAASQTPRHPPR